MLHTRKPMTEETAAEMAARNQRRLEIVKRVLGDKYAHHPAHHVQRKEDALELCICPKCFSIGKSESFERFSAN